MPKPVFQIDKRVMNRLFSEIKEGKCENFEGVYKDGKFEQIRMINENIVEIERIDDYTYNPKTMMTIPRSYDIHTFKNGEQIKVKTPDYIMWLMS
jgi:phenylalanyl-tRNA synthetase beta subunit